MKNPHADIGDEDRQAYFEYLGEKVKRHSMKTEIKWHGWERTEGGVGGLSLNIGYLPGRKSPALYLTERARITPLAYFRNEDHAQRATRFIDEIVEILEKK